jgi:hypothetical protein
LDPDLRSALLGVGIAFCAIFGGLTIYAAVQLGAGLNTYGDLLALAFLALSFLVIAMIAAGLIGAMRNPPPPEEPQAYRWREPEGWREDEGSEEDWTEERESEDWPPRE